MAEPHGTPLLEPLGHLPRLEGLWRAKARGRLPHALLFHGPAGVGKFRAACWFAAGLVCQRGPAAPCLVCGACKRIQAGSHADWLVLDPVAQGLETIPISWFTPREDSPAERVDSFLSLKSAEGGVRALVLRAAERMHSAAQNALLKTLEEPGADALLILVADRPGELLSTVRSRCVPVRFGSLEAALVLRVLAGVAAQHGLELDSSAQRRLCEWAEGSPGEALRLARQDAPAVVELLLDCVERGRAPLEAAAGIWELTGEFEGATPRAQARARARAALALLLTLLADQLRLRLGLGGERLRMPSLAQRLSQALAAAPRPAIERALEAALRARQDIEAHAAPEAALERAFLALAEVSRSAASRSQPA